jgi:hypothetical protein
MYLWLSVSSAGDCFNDFPKLQEDDLRQLTLGVYQLKLAKSYSVDHLNTDGSDEMFVNTETLKSISLWRAHPRNHTTEATWAHVSTTRAPNRHWQYQPLTITSSYSIQSLCDLLDTWRLWIFPISNPSSCLFTNISSEPSVFRCNGQRLVLPVSVRCSGGRYMRPCCFSCVVPGMCSSPRQYIGPACWQRQIV